MKNGRIYEVAIDENDVGHRGDMMLLHEMEDHLSEPAVAAKRARLYWNGEQTAAPCEEVYVKEAKVVREVTPVDKNAVFQELYRVDNGQSTGSDHSR